MELLAFKIQILYKIIISCFNDCLLYGCIWLIAYGFISPLVYLPSPVLAGAPFL